MGTINNIGNVLLPAGSTTVDVQALLNAATTAAQQPLVLLQQQQSTLQTQSSTLTALQNDISALSTAVTALGDPSGGVSALSATSSNSNVLTASADFTATAESHNVTVTSLATTASYYTNAVASSSTAIATGTFSIAVGASAPVTVTVDSTNDTLAGLASSINGLNAGVTASVVNDANGARLAISSNTSGLPGDLTVSANTTGLTFNKAVTGANAALTVDGVPIDSTSNTVTGVIPGVTLNLVGASPSTSVSINVTPNTTQASSAINTFVSAWNTVIQDFNSEFTVGSGATNVQPLESDGTVRDAQQQLLAAVTYSIGGNNGFVNLASMGIDLNNDGTMTVDSSKLTSALGNNFSNVQSLLQGTSGFSTYMSNVLNQLTDPTQGSLTLDLQGMTQSNQDLSNQISDMQSTLAAKNQFLTAQYDQVQVALQELPLIQSQVTQQLGSLKTS
jgi:flagellar hook-associated protein 2